MRAINPGVIYASASGYGPTGPYVDRPGQDLLIQALAGLMAITGKEPDGARAVGVSAVDHHGAALLALGILAALVRRGRTGQGCRVDVSLLSSAIDLQLESFTTYLNGGKPPSSVREPPHLAGWYYNAPYGVYRTADGHMALSIAPLETVGKIMDIPALLGIAESEIYGRRVEIANLIAARFLEHPECPLGRSIHQACDLARAGERLCRCRRRSAGAAYQEFHDCARRGRFARYAGQPSGDL